MEILEFSWLPALAGGIMIGTASALLMAFNGRVAGISGILGGLLSRWSPDQWSLRHWQALYQIIGCDPSLCGVRNAHGIFFGRTSMIRYSFFSFLSGLLFALGLSVSGMTEPGKVIGFLNITRSWDPSLVFVMGGAVITYFILFRLIHKRSAPLFALQFSIPERKDIDLPLLGGAVLFGIGWGIGGFCPGPAVASIFTGKPNVLLFAGSMILGMVIADQLRPLLSGKTKHLLNQGFWKTGNPDKKLEPATATGTSSNSN